MRISEDSLTEALEYVLNGTDITELAEIVYGEDPTVEQIVDFARVAVESLLLECLVENYKEWLMKTHCKLGGVKTKYGKEQSRIERKVVEDEYDTWQKKFLKVFEGCFSKNQELLDEIRIKFENYKFNKKNAVNDNSILFFTFSLYDIASAKCEKKSQLARKYAKAAYEALKKPSDNHALYVDEKKLMTFTEELIGENYKQVFIKVFLKFIQSLYGSEELHDIERYLFFERFQGFIIATNLSIKVASRLLPEDCIVIREDSDINRENSKKIYKSIYYEKKQIKRGRRQRIYRNYRKNTTCYRYFPKKCRVYG